MSAKRRTRSTKEHVVTSYRPMTHLQFEGARHLHPERLPTKQKEKTASLRIFDVTKNTVDKVQPYAGTIRRLMLSGLKITSVPDSLTCRMLLLERLDLSENMLGDGSLPDSLQALVNLRELNLSGNKFSKVPAKLNKLKNLMRLDVSHNNIESLRGAEKLRRMQVLVVNNNRFTVLFKDLAQMRKLEILDCSCNNIREIGVEIRNLQALKDVNVSDNRITVLPVDIFKLPLLESLKASHNQISKVPNFTIPPQNRHWLSELDLSENVINKFPGLLLTMTKKLYLRANKIKALNWNSMKNVDWQTDQELVVDDNPLKTPPRDVCDCGLKSMLHYLKEVQADVSVYQGIKMFVIGSPESGKTSFVNSLVDNQARLSTELYEKSSGIETYDVEFECTPMSEEDTHLRVLQLSIWDFCGNPFYLSPHYLFLEQPAIVVLTFNMKTYTSESFDKMVGCWFDWMLAKSNKQVVLLVGTNKDKLKLHEAKAVCSEVKTRLSDYLKKQREIIEKKLAAIEKLKNISPTLQDQFKTYTTLLQSKFTVQSEVIMISSAEFIGFDIIRASIEKLANDKKLFPDVLRLIPTFWLDVENYIEEKGSQEIVPVMEWDDYEKEIVGKFGMKHLLKMITQYLHETGKILWFQKYPSLEKYVFLRPSWLFDINKCLFRHDLKEKLNVDVEDAFKSIGINQVKFESLKNEFLSQGIIDKEFLRCLFSQLVPIEETSNFQFILKLLMEGFECGYPVTKVSRTEYDLNVEPDDKGNVKATKFLLPWFRILEEAESVQELWQPLEERRRLVALCKFPKYMPPGMFETLSVRCHRSGHNLRFLSHWNRGIHARHKTLKVQIKISYTQMLDSEGATLRFEMRDEADKDVEETPASAMWGILLPVLIDFEDILQGFSGTLVERLMECPHCRSASFIGEWLTPKETQNMATRPCEACGEQVDTAFLVQPREKKRDDVLFQLAKTRRRRAAITTDPQLPHAARQLANARRVATFVLPPPPSALPPIIEVRLEDNPNLIEKEPDVSEPVVETQVKVKEESPEAENDMAADISQFLGSRFAHMRRDKLNRVEELHLKMLISEDESN
ncbi:hypothetical protein CHS0354_007195 [Potamilus streckersoni]|uniref:non-specific serine/threonine protein kinase n=1 Tax=Potamilus streckersoni TaxID=2493646 RepID=A0AAE0W8T8_9BIVA|nr:hypothetical protein CHS0354_007195 [Potamilus streckersoni]